MNTKHKRFGFRKAVSGFILLTFLTGQVFTSASVQAQILPMPGTPVSLTAGFQPPVLLGLKIHPENPLLFDFIVDQGASQLSQDELKSETEKLVKYFLAALTIPDKEVWVNLSPYEKDRVIPDVLGQTTMGKTMLEQDYMLKQLASSLTNPDEKLGQEFWNKVKTETQKQLGTTDVPMNTFNKVWIVPQKAEVLESQGIVLVSEKRLKLMMDQDYVAMDKNAQSQNGKAKDVSTISSNIFKDTILPNIEKEINEGKNFADVRQIYNSVILAAWYKKALKESLLGKVYADKGKVAGVESGDKEMKQRIYEQYLAAFKKGVYNVIKEEEDVTGDLIPRKYFSGGIAEFGLAGGKVLQVRAGSPLEVKNQLSASGIHIAEVFTAEDRAGDGKAVFARAGSPLEEKIQELSAKIFNQDIVTTFRNYYGTKYYTADEVAARLNEYLNDFQSNIRKVVDDEADIDVVEKQLNKLMIHIRKQQFDYDIWIKEVKQQIPELRKIRAAEFPPGIFEFKRMLHRVERGSMSVIIDISGEEAAKRYGYGEDFAPLYDRMIDEINKSYKGRIGITSPGIIRIIKDILAENGLSQYRSAQSAGEEFLSYIEKVEAREMQVVVDARGDEVRRSYGFGKRFADYYDEFHDRLKVELDRRGGLYPDHIISIAKGVLKQFQNNESELFTKRFDIRRQQHATEKKELANWRDEFDKALRFAVESTGTGLVPLSYKGDPDKELRQFAKAENLLNRVQAFDDSYKGEFAIEDIVQGLEEARSTYNRHRATQTVFEQMKEYVDRVRLHKAQIVRGATGEQMRKAYGYGQKFTEFYDAFHSEMERELRRRGSLSIDEVLAIMDSVFQKMMSGATVELADTDNEVDYYAILGIPRNASDDDMKKAYRKLAMKYHPDRNKGDQEAERKFKEINEANSILSNPTFRAVYDSMGHRAALQEMFEAMKGKGRSSSSAAEQKASKSASSQIIEQLDLGKIAVRDERVDKIIAGSGFYNQDKSRREIYGSAKAIVHMDGRAPRGLDGKIFLPRFLSTVFQQARSLGDVDSTQIVFLEAGARPLYDAAKLTARVDNESFPEQNLKAVWATMGNYQAMKDDPQQAVLFVKYLYDQGVLLPNLLIVDTDTGLNSSHGEKIEAARLGTAAIFAKTLLDPNIIQRANAQFGLQLKPYNVGSNGNRLELLYMHSEYVGHPEKIKEDARKEGIADEISERLVLRGYNTTGGFFSNQDIQARMDEFLSRGSDSLENYISGSWAPIDIFIKTVSIENRFVLNNTGQVVVITKRPYKGDPTQQITPQQLRMNILSRAIEDTGLLMATLDYLEGQGFDISSEAEALINNLREVLHASSGVAEVQQVASAPTVEAAPALNPGGIDFDPTNMNLQIKRDGRGVPLPLPQQNLEQINIQGLFPVIINIVPVNTQTLPLFLGKSVELSPDPSLLAGQNSS